MFALLLFLLIIFILWPFLKLAWKLWRNVRQAQRFMRDPLGEAMRQAQEQARRNENRQSGTYSQAHNTYNGSKKKIARDVGEYVPFTEISDSTASGKAEDTRTEFKTESQISDVEWEDL